MAQISTVLAGKAAPASPSPLWGGDRGGGNGRANSICDSPAPKGEGEARLLFATLPSGPGCCQRTDLQGRRSGKTGGRRLAHLSNLRASSRPPAGDFCSRLLAAPRQYLASALATAATALSEIQAGPVCALSPHAGVIMPPGKPDGGSSPASRLRLPRGGGAGPSPRNHRHDRCSRREELTRIMTQRRKAWRKGSEESLTMQESEGFGS
jgi:hypothetical protein